MDTKVLKDIDFLQYNLNKGYRLVCLCRQVQGEKAAPTGSKTFCGVLILFSPIFVYDRASQPVAHMPHCAFHVACVALAGVKLV